MHRTEWCNIVISRSHYCNTSTTVKIRNLYILLP